jgi:hypothetical protein
VLDDDVLLDDMVEMRTQPVFVFRRRFEDIHDTPLRGYLAKGP